MDTLPRRLSLLTPSGHLTLGNLLGALRGIPAAGVGDLPPTPSAEGQQ